MTDSVTFVLRGKRYTLTPTEARASMNGVEPKAVSKYYVIINRRRYPIKQVVSVLTGRGLSEFHTADAWSILHRLGFKLKTLGRMYY